MSRQEGDVPGQRDQAAIAEYARAYSENYGFERVMVSTRRRPIVAWLNRHRPKSVVEVGCGSDLLVEAADVAGVPFSTWIIVEPSEEFVRIAADRTTHDSRLHSRVHVVHDFIEQAVERVEELCPDKADAVVCSSVLHEIPEPLQMLHAIREVMRPSGSRLHVNVPNARSLHRRLARAMGLIPDERTMSNRNIELGQFGVLDADALSGLVLDAGFEIEATGGIMLKPFTHAQMEALPFGTPELLDGLEILGSELPELAAEVYVEARMGSQPARSE